MQRRRKFLLVGIASGAAALAAGAALAQGPAAGGDDGKAEDDTNEAGEVEAPITGDALQQATDAALAHLGEGRVTETEVDDEESKYEVEVTLDDGTQVDVQLDEQFNVVGTERD